MMDESPTLINRNPTTDDLFLLNAAHHAHRNFFQITQATISHIYRKNKKAKIKYSTLQKNKSQGGLEAPNQLQYTLNQINLTNNNTSWMQLEQTHCQNLSVAALPFKPPSSFKNHNCFKNVVISTTLTAWWKVLKTSNSSGKIQISTFTRPLNTTAHGNREVSHIFTTSSTSNSCHSQIQSRNMELETSNLFNIYTLN